MPTIRFLTQPDLQIGSEIARLLEEQPSPSRVVFVSAWANRQTLLRLRSKLKALSTAGIPVRIVVGVDLGGTSKEALLELHSWDVDAWLIKNRRSGSTFHPKVFVIERQDRADILLGSSNLTEGGLFTNYEGVVHLRYDFADERAAFDEFLVAFQRFLEPSGATAQKLGSDLLRRLVARGDIPTEEEIRQRQRAAFRERRRRGAAQKESPFGTETVPPPPALPSDVLAELLGQLRRTSTPRRRVTGGRPRTRSRQPTPAEGELVPPARIAPTAFFMTLPKMRGRTIPGEARVPLDARDLARDFWGWPTRYTPSASPRGGAARVYMNWKPVWRIRRADQALGQSRLDEVRMYEYANSSDFRFYSSGLLDLGADQGDVVRIARIAEPDAEFECVLAPVGSAAYDEWIHHCTEPVRNSNRRFGYA